MQEVILIDKVGKKNSVVINIEFTNKNLAKNLPELYLYYKLRVATVATGGWVKDFIYTKNERYNVLPNLVKLGWITEDLKKINKYRDVVANCGCKSKVSADLSGFELSDMETFKGYVIAVNEKYLLDKKEKLNKQISDCLTKGKSVPRSWIRLKGATQIELATTKTKDGDITTITGRAFNDELARLMGLGTATITRWRAKSKDNGFNTYELRNIRVNTNHLHKATKVVVEDRRAKGSVYHARDNKAAIFTKDLLITSGIKLFIVSGKNTNAKRDARVKLVNKIMAKRNVELV